jgi:hypothetical protein
MISLSVKSDSVAQNYMWLSSLSADKIRSEDVQDISIKRRLEKHPV